MDGSLLQFVLAVFTAMLLQTWYLHREIRRSREESIRHTDRSFDRLSVSHDQLRTDFQRNHDQLRADFEKSHDQLRADFAEHKDITERNHRETQRQLAKLTDGLGDARERLTRIEGYLRIGLPEPPEPSATG
ncbi:MAG: hypothetical protein F4Y12_05555 [Acidimicrobiaceae bacterium]|nr:hypothetical protein [Acidimicrobiaceae bacterium]MYH77081.1 hypothetical protein [Acidimicrobiaceae bacterium]MYK76456.1 hypothetical protein [Acidimicrobiaceae bacterium]